MAFCPECGKSTAPEATKCVHCGKELAAAQHKPVGGRFKGTMMMQSAPVAAAAATPAKLPDAPSLATPSESAKPESAPPPAAAAAPKPMLKATMLGAGIAVPPPAAAGAVAQPATTPEAAAGAAAPAPAEEAKRKMAFAATAPAHAAFTLPTEAAATSPTDASPAAEPKKYLPGDPMAPHPNAAARPHSAPRRGVVHVDPSKTWVYVVIGCVGMLLIGAAGFGMAVYLGLVSFGK